MKTYRENLIEVVIKNSISKSWESAVLEWEIDDCEEDENRSEMCVCGKEGLRYLYTICNKINSRRLFPIGSCCIKKFDRADLNEEISVREGMFKLLHAVSDNKFIELTTEFFSKKLIAALFEEGAFDTEYNNFDGTRDYEFLIKMFNKRKKEDITPNMWKKIRAIIAYSIKPYLEEQLSNKIRK